MNALIAYYSRTGSNEKLVNELEAKLGCDVEKIIDTVNRKGIWGWFKSGYQASRKRTSKIEPINKDPGSYDLVVFCYPFWSGLMPPPMRSYISENRSKFNKVALMSVSGRGKNNGKAVPDFEDATGKKSSATLILSQLDIRRSSYKDKLQEFAESISKLQA
jgi:flavodoxin